MKKNDDDDDKCKGCDGNNPDCHQFDPEDVREGIMDILSNLPGTKVTIEGMAPLPDQKNLIMVAVSHSANVEPLTLIYFTAIMMRYVLMNSACGLNQLLDALGLCLESVEQQGLFSTGSQEDVKSVMKAMEALNKGTPPDGSTFH